MEGKTALACGGERQSGETKWGDEVGDKVGNKVGDKVLGRQQSSSLCSAYSDFSFLISAFQLLYRRVSLVDAPWFQVFGRY